MCNHVFLYPEDIGDNLNKDGVTLTGTCRNCGETQRSYGAKWAAREVGMYYQSHPHGLKFVDDFLEEPSLKWGKE